MRERTHSVDFCVVGGGLSGLCAAVAAARHGARVALMHDRPVLGGNASSEVRMWICGARGENNRETGLVEEIQLENLYRNPGWCWSIWDSVLYEKVRGEPNLTLLLNCSCNALEMDGGRIRCVRGWQLTSETWHTVEAALFADCSGDGVLAPLSGAEFRLGWEAAGEFGEDIEPPQADRKTMGMSCLIQARQTTRPQPFAPPAWANRYPSCEDLPHRGHAPGSNFWWIELGGCRDSIHDGEEIRDELLKVAFGVWDHVKNHCRDRARWADWTLEWVGFLPGKRESRRYVGDHILTQNDVRSEGRFDDLVAYGGWPMDDHHPAGMDHPHAPTTFHPAPSPFGIAYRCLYSKNVANLLFAGRNISATHAAMSATRVMATCATLGQAVGTAAALAARDGLSPRGVLERRIDELQQTLMDDDCYLPWHVRAVGELTRSASLTATEGDAQPLRSGVDRPVGDEANAWVCHGGAWAQYAWQRPQRLRELRFVFDSDLSRAGKNMPCCYPLDAPAAAVPPTLVRRFRVRALGEDERWHTIAQADDNHQRLVRIPVDISTAAVRLLPQATWQDEAGSPGAQGMRVFAWDVR